MIDGLNPEIERLNAKLQEQATQRSNQLAADFKEVLGTPAGRRVLWHLMDRAGTFRLSYVSERPHDTAFNDGCRDMGNYLLDEVMKVDVHIFSLMQGEHRASKEREKELIDKAKREE